MDPIFSNLILGASVVTGLGAASIAGLKAWNGWLDFKKLELSQHFGGGGGGDRMVPPAGGRIEIADLKERVRKLEAIAAGIEL